MAVLCVRNTSIEDVHAGIEPHSPAGDYSDVKVVTSVGEIPWPRASRIRDDEMRAFMKQVVDRLYTVLLRLDEPEFVERIDQYARRMTRPTSSPIGFSRRRAAASKHARLSSGFVAIEPGLRCVLGGGRIGHDLFRVPNSRPASRCVKPQRCRMARMTTGTKTLFALRERLRGPARHIGDDWLAGTLLLRQPGMGGAGALQGGRQRRRVEQHLGKPELIFGCQADDVSILDRLADRLLGGIDDEIAHGPALDLRSPPDHGEGFGGEPRIDPCCAPSIFSHGNHGSTNSRP